MSAPDKHRGNLLARVVLDYSLSAAPKGDALGNALGDSIVDKMSEPSVPPVASADERAAILKMFEDGPGGSGAPVGGSGLRIGAASSRVVRDFDPEGKWERDGLVSVGADGRPTAQANVGGVSVFPSDERGFFSGSASNPVDEGSRITPAMKEANALHKQALYEKFQRDVLLGEALSFADDVAMRKAASQGMTGMEKTHLLLDVLNLGGDGFLAPIGALAGVADAALYLYEGKKLDAGISLAGTLPFIGASLSAERVAERSVVRVEGGVGKLASFSEREVGALRGAGLTDAEIARHVELFGDINLFRGTSAGFPGNPGLQKFGITPASTDPVVATIFALESRAKGGDPILIFGERSHFGREIDLGNNGEVRRVLEREVMVDISPAAFAAKAPNQVSADVARQVLGEMGVARLPSMIRGTEDATKFLNNTPRMTPEQIQEFLLRVRQR